MLSRPRTARLLIFSAARAVAALLLALALLPGASILRAASSPEKHLCAMPCCAGKAPHEAGSCAHAFADHRHDDDAHDETGDASTANHEPAGDAQSATAHDEHAHASPSALTQAKPDTHDTHDTRDTHDTHVAVVHESAGAHPTPRVKRPASLKASVGRPCDPECRAGGGVSTQRRPSRDGAATSPVARLHLPVFILSASFVFRPLPPSSERRRQTRPRAPPPSSLPLV